jgi:hypothetical protein
MGALITVAKYQALVPPANQKPLFLATLAAYTQGQVDNQNLLAALPNDFDLDLAVGVQLDAVGVRVGATRVLEVPLTGVFFAWDTVGLGWGEGTWLGPYVDGDTLYDLPDSDFRTLLYAVIAKNHWDGTIPGAYAVLAIAFAGMGYTFLIQDNQDMSLTYIVIGPPLSVVMRALLIAGQLTLKPAGVRITGYFKPSVPDEPIFGWGPDSATIGGWGTGCWLEPV